MTTNFFDCIYSTLLRNADRELIVWPGPQAIAQTYTGGATLNRITAIRHELLLSGVQPGQLVVLALPVSFDLICALLAIMAHGAIPVLPPAASSLITLLSVLKREGIRAVITQKKLRFPLSWLAKRAGLTIITLEGVAAAAAPHLPPQPVQADQPALISHSSGSTGRPKAIRRSHRVLQAQHQALSAAFPPWPGQRDFPLFPNILLHNLAVGSVSILPALPRFKLDQLDPAQIIRQLVDERVQTLTGNVYYYQKLSYYLAMYPRSFSGVRAVGIGGSPVPESLVELLKRYFTEADIYIIYGSSEAEPIAVRNTALQPATPRSGYAVGTIHPAIEVTIQPLGTLLFPDGSSHVTGEINVRGAHVTTADTWLPTGDFGYVDATGQLILTGRRGNERIHGGVQHYQIEHVLSMVGGVNRVAARANATEFTIYVEGNAQETDIRYALTAYFPAGICTQLLFRKKLPVDARHLSKIRYDQLT